MAGKFLTRGAIVDTVKSEHRVNAIRRRNGLTRHPVRVTPCGCSDPNCGAFHVVETERMIPTPEECAARLIEDNQKRPPGYAGGTDAPLKTLRVGTAQRPEARGAGEPD